MDYTFVLKNLWVFVAVAIWELIWKAVAMWKAAQNKQLTWYIAILLVNSAGLLSILYIKFFQKSKGEVK